MRALENNACELQRTCPPCGACPALAVMVTITIVLTEEEERMDWLVQRM